MENCDDLLGSILDNELILLVPRGGNRTTDTAIFESQVLLLPTD